MAPRRGVGKHKRLVNSRVEAPGRDRIDVTVACSAGQLSQRLRRATATLTGPYELG